MAEKVTLIDAPGEGTLGQILATYYQQRTRYEEDMKLEAFIMTAAYIVQLLAYYFELKEKIKDRDRILGKELDFLDYLHQRRNVDAGELEKKDLIRTKLGEISASVCEESARYKDETIGDAQSFKDMEEVFAQCSCAGIPDGWGTHENTLAAGMAMTSAGTIMATTAKRRAEDFNVKRIDLIRNANIAIRGLFTADSVLAYYQQAVAIYQGLVDIYISGFNSAGAGLGVALQRLSGASGGRGTTVSTGPLTIQTAGSPPNSPNVQTIGEP